MDKIYKSCDNCQRNRRPCKCRKADKGADVEKCRDYIEALPGKEVKTCGR